MNVTQKIDIFLDEAKRGRPKKFNQKEYEFYVVVQGKIQSGWEYREDAKEMLDDLPSGTTGKIYKKQGLKKLGLDPNNNKDWGEPI